MAELQRAVDEAKKHCVPRAIVVINPGNPTGVQHTCLFLCEDILLLRRVCGFCENEVTDFFYVLLTVHLSVILVIYQLNAQILVL